LPSQVADAVILLIRKLSDADAFTVTSEPFQYCVSFRLFVDSLSAISTAGFSVSTANRYATPFSLDFVAIFPDLSLI